MHILSFLQYELLYQHEKNRDRNFESKVNMSITELSSPRLLRGTDVYYAKNRELMPVKCTVSGLCMYHVSFPPLLGDD